MILVVDERRSREGKKESEILFQDFQYLCDFLEGYKIGYASSCVLVGCDRVRKIDKIVLYKTQYERAKSLRFYEDVINRLGEVLKDYTVEYIE